MTARTVSSFRAKLVQQNNKKLDIFMDRSADVQAITSSKAAMIQVSLDKKIRQCVWYKQANSTGNTTANQSCHIWPCCGRAMQLIEFQTTITYDTIRYEMLF